MTHIHEIKLSGEDEFAARFNYVSDLFKKFIESEIEEDEIKNYEAYCDAKYCLEQGLPIAGFTK